MYSEAWKRDADPEQFWALVELARNNRPAFMEAIKGADRRELIRFAWMFEELASRLGEDRFRRYTDPKFSEDVTDDLWDEVVGKGRAFYEDVSTHPEKMPADVDYSDPSHKIRYDVGNVFFERFGKEIPPYSYDY